MKISFESDSKEKDRLIANRIGDRAALEIPEHWDRYRTNQPPNRAAIPLHIRPGFRGYRRNHPWAGFLVSSCTL